MNLLFLSLFLILAPQSATSAAKRAPDARTQVHRNQEAKPDDRAAAIDDSVVFPAKVVNTAVAPDVPISIIRTPPRDRYDWITWGGGVLLSLVGIGGVIVAVGTLRFIKRQVIEMRRQRRVMHRTLQSIEKQASVMDKQTLILQASVGAAQKSADAAQASVDAILSKERARIRVEIKGIELDKGAAHVNYAVTCFGPTHAFVIDSWATAKTSASDAPILIDLKFPASLPSVLHNQTILKTAFILDKLRFEPSDIEAVHKQKLLVHIVGVISYRDVFDEAHTTAFSYFL